MVSNSAKIKRRKLHEFQSFILHPKSGNLRDSLYENMILDVIMAYSAPDHSISYDGTLYHIEKDYSIKDIPKLHIDSALERLINEKIITKQNQTLIMSESAFLQIQKNVDSVDILKSSVYNELKNKIKEKIEIQDEKLTLIITIFEEIIADSFSRYGIIVARIFVDENKSSGTFKDLAAVAENFQKSILPLVSVDDRDKLEKIFNEFFNTPSSELNRYLYALAQSYILLEILNVDPELKKIQEQAWKQKKIYLDTNVLIPLLFSADPLHESVNMIIQNTIKLGAQIVVSETTANEFEKKLNDFRKDHDTSVVTFRQPLIEKLDHDDEFLKTYFNESKNISGLTLENFCLKYENYPILLEKLGIKVEDDFTASIKEHPDLEDLEAKLRTYSARKTTRTAFHDAYHILKIKELRKNSKGNELGPNFWFLTADHSLPKVEHEKYGWVKVSNSIMIEIWINFISPFISPETTIDFKGKALTKLLSSNFTSYKINSNDLTNVMKIFMNDKVFTNDELAVIIGDSYAKEIMRKIKDLLDKGEDLGISEVKPFVDRVGKVLKDHYEEKLSRQDSTHAQKLSFEKHEHDKEISLIKSKLDHLTEKFTVLEEKSVTLEEKSVTLEEKSVTLEEKSTQKDEQYNRLKKILWLILASAGINAIFALVFSRVEWVTLDHIVISLLGLLGLESIAIFTLLIKTRLKKQKRLPWSRSEKMTLIFGLISIILSIILGID